MVDDGEGRRHAERADDAVGAEDGDGDREHVAAGRGAAAADLSPASGGVEIGRSCGHHAGGGFVGAGRGDGGAAGVDDDDPGPGSAGELVDESDEGGRVALGEGPVGAQRQRERVVLDAVGERSFLGLPVRQAERERERQEDEAGDREVADEEPAPHATASGTQSR